MLEISFKVDGKKRAEGDALAERLRKALAEAKLIVEPVSKSKWAATHCPK